MSKRYGRNQRRAHRTRIAELEKELAKTKAYAAKLDRDCRDYNAEIASAKRIVGEYCIAFHPNTQTLHFKSHDWATIQQYDYTNGTSISRYWDWSKNPNVDQTVRIEHIRLPIICALASEEIRLARHFKVAYDGKVYGYAVDSMVFKFARFPQALVRDIGERIAALILAENAQDFQHHEPKRHTRDERDPRTYTPQFNANAFKF